MTEPQKKSGHGCLFYGGIVAAVILLVILLAAYAAFQFTRGLINQYTDTKPIAVPTVQYSDDQIKSLRDRIDGFKKAMQDGKRTEPLALTAEEINALIAKNPDAAALQVRLYVTFDEDRIQAQLSVPIEKLGVNMLRGRYFNGSGEFLLSLHDGSPQVKVKSLTVKGRPLPENFMRPIQAENFAAGWTNNPDFKAALGKLQEVKIEGGKLVVVPKRE